LGYILLGAVSILNHVPTHGSVENNFCGKGIFDIASRDIDAFLDKLIDLDWMRQRYQLPEGTDG